MQKMRAVAFMKTTRPAKFGNQALTNNEENEHPAKMTHSIPDFVSRGWPKTQDFFPDLESASPRYKIKT